MITWGCSIRLGSLVQVTDDYKGNKNIYGVVVSQIGDNLYTVMPEVGNICMTAYASQVILLAEPTVEMEEKVKALDLAHRLAKERLYRKEGFKLPIDPNLDNRRFRGGRRPRFK